MLVLRGKLLKQIFSENWPQFVQEHPHIRSAIHKNVEKMILCGTDDMGFHLYKCEKCGAEKKVPHTCKSRFCSKCGVRQTDIWIERYTTVFANSQYQHVIFSPPSEFRQYFGIGRTPYFNALYDSVNQTLKDWYDVKGYLPGGMDVLHTFGRDIKFHAHIHVLLTCGGLDTSQTKWITCNYLSHEFLKAHFKSHFIENIKKCWKQQDIQLIPDNLKSLFDPLYQEAIITKLTSLIWYVNIGERLSNAEFVIRYIGRYTKRPAIAESKILSYDGKTVTFTYQDHKTAKKAILTLPVLTFIGKLIRHIPDIHFRIIRYFGFYANRIRGKLLPKAFILFKQNYEKARQKLANLSSWWRERIQRLTKLDPLICSTCSVPLSLISVVYATGNDPNAFRTTRAKDT